MFVDHIRIFAKAGDGGHGCTSFRREKHVPKGGPDGGDGGRGANVVLVVDHHTDNLKEFFFRPNQKAERGVHGQGQRKTGKSGKDLILKVPAGTIVYKTTPPVPKKKKDDEFDEEFPEDGDWAGEFVTDKDGSQVLKEETPGETNALLEVEAPLEEEEESGEAPHPYGEKIADLTEIGQRYVLCEGGIGGKGNWNFRTDSNQAPIEFTMGEPGDEGWFNLELRRIADVGLVGFPNAGKSTLLGALSNAAPKVASYPFTTLKPMVGVVDFPGFYRATVADIPGLIEGAHNNVGLGHDFLRHISRCSIFLFVVDTAGVDQRDPISDIQILRKELRLYDEELGEREWLIVANKIDLEESEMYLSALKTRFPKQEIFPISAANGDGLEALREKLCSLVGKRP
ncbi:MAG: GTPase ObgE [Verrucomicrobiales bacterium]|nr:GTPase ObgE [Verrucomicrobiales bacterium]